MNKRFTAEGLRQAAEEAAWTFGIAFAISFVGWINGWAALPDIEGAGAALRAASLAGSLAVSKSLIWLLTGTPATPREQAPRA